MYQIIALCLLGKIRVKDATVPSAKNMKHRIICLGLWCYSCGWLLLLEPLKHLGYQKAQDDVQTDNLEKSVCLLLVHETLQLTSCTLGNVPLDGAGLNVKLWNCVPMQATLPAVTPPLRDWKEDIQKTTFRKVFYFLEGGIQPIHSVWLRRCC